MCWSWFVAIATIKEFMCVLVWWLAICSLKYTWGCGGLWTPQYPPNQPRVIHDWFPFQQKDWIRFWIYHQNNQPEFLEIQVHFVPYPDPYLFHARIIPRRTHPPSPPFIDIQVYSTHQIYPTSSLCCIYASDEDSVSRLSYLFAHLRLLSSGSFSSLIFSLLLFSSLWLFPSLLFICPYCRKFDF